MMATDIATKKGASPYRSAATIQISKAKANLEIIEPEKLPVLARALDDAINIPATDAEIAKGLAIFQAAVKWPGVDVIADRRAYLATLHHLIKERGYSREVVENGLWTALSRYSWVPSQAEVLNEMRASKEELLSHGRYLGSCAINRKIIKTVRAARARYADPDRAKEATDEIARLYKIY